MFALVFRLSLATLVVVSLRAGDRGTKVVALALAFAAVATELLRSAASHRYEHLEWGVFGVDLALFLTLLLIALAVGRPWMICIASLQLVTVLGHVAKVINPTIWPLAYAWMMQASSFPSLVLLLVGIVTAQRRVRAATESGS